MSLPHLANQSRYAISLTFSPLSESRLPESCSESLFNFAPSPHFSALYGHSFPFDIVRFRSCIVPRLSGTPRSISHADDPLLPIEISCAQLHVAFFRAFCAAPLASVSQEL